MAQYDDFNSSTTLTTIKTNTSRAWVQHIAACAACLSAFAVGITLGWSSPAGPKLIKGEAGFSVSNKENFSVGSLLTIGAAISCFPTGYLTDKIGRRILLLGTVPVFVISWTIIMYATSVTMLYIGRFLLGINAGAVCVVAPLYAVEICQKEIRGAMGSYFQLLLSAGILFIYVIGSGLQIFWFSFVGCLMTILFGIIFFFFPETPVYYLAKGNVTEARKSLIFFRGMNYDLEPELYELSEYLNEKKNVMSSSWNVFKSKQGMKSLGMSIGVMIFQQLSGVNAFIFNATNIFENAGTPFDARYETIIIGAMQVLGSLLGTFLVNKVGRLTLLGVSAISMSLSTLTIGFYFLFKENDYPLDKVSWILLLSLYVFNIMFSIGFGAIPWMILSEIMPPKIKGLGTSLACTINWISAFLVTFFFSDLINSLGRSVTFGLFAIASAGAAVFTYKVLPETKGKSFEEIQRELSGESTGRNFVK